MSSPTFALDMDIAMCRTVADDDYVLPTDLNNIVKCLKDVVAILQTINSSTVARYGLAEDLYILPDCVAAHVIQPIDHNAICGFMSVLNDVLQDIASSFQW